MADIVSQLNLTEKELEENKEELEEIVRLIDIIKSTNMSGKDIIDASSLSTQISELSKILKKSIGDNWVNGLLKEIKGLSNIPKDSSVQNELKSIIEKANEDYKKAIESRNSISKINESGFTGQAPKVNTDSLNSEIKSFNSSLEDEFGNLEDDFGVLEDTIDTNIQNGDTQELVDTIKKYRDKLEDLNNKEASNFENEIKQVDELLGIINDTNVNDIKAKFKNLKADQSERVSESALRPQLEEAYDYKDELTKYINSVLKVILPKDTIDENSKNVFNSRENSALYGINVANADSFSDAEIEKLKKENELIEYRNKIYYIDHDFEMDDQYLETLKGIISGLREYIELRKQVSSTSSINKVAQKRILNTDGSVNSLYKDYIRPSSRDDKNNTTAKEIQIENGKKQVYEIYAIPYKNEDIDTVASLFENTSEQRLNGFYDEKGEHHSGIKEINEGLEKVAEQLLNSIKEGVKFKTEVGADTIDFNSLLNSIVSNALDKEINEITAIELKNKNNREATLDDVINYLESQGADGLPYAGTWGDYNNPINYIKKLGDRLSGTDFDSDYITDEFKNINFKSTDENKIEEAKSKFAEAVSTMASDYINNVKTSVDSFSENENIEQVEFDTLKSEKNRSNKGLVDKVQKAQQLVDDYQGKLNNVNELLQEFENAIDTGNLETITGQDEFNMSGKTLPEQILDAANELKDQFQIIYESEFRDSLGKIKETPLRINKDIFIQTIDAIGEKFNDLVNSEKFTSLVDTTSNENDATKELIAKNVEKLSKANDAATQQYTKEYQKALLNKSNLVGQNKQLEYLSNSGLLSEEQLNSVNKKLKNNKTILDGIDNTIDDIKTKSENSNLDIDFESLDNQVGSVQGIYNEFIQLFGGYKNAERIINKALSSLGTINETTVRDFVNLNEEVRDSGIEVSELAKKLKTLKASGLAEMLNYSSAENLLNTTDTKGLKNNELVKEQYNNEVRNILYNAIRNIPSGSAGNTYGLKTIGEMTSSITNTGDTLDQLDNQVKELASSDFGTKNKTLIANLSKQILSLKNEYELIELGIKSDSSYGNIKLAFTSAGKLNRDLVLLDAKIQEALNKQVEQQEKEIQDNQKAYEDTRKSDASNILNSVSNQETLSGQRMPLADQLQYMEDQLRHFVDVYGTENDEYIAILKRVRQIEQQIETERHKEREQDINDAFRAEDERKKAAQEAQRSQQQAYQQILNSVKQISNNIQNVIRNILNTLRRSIQVIKNLILGGFRTISRVVSGIKRIIQLFGNFGNRVKGVNNNTNLLKGSFTELKSKIDLLVGAYDRLFNNDYINNGRKLLQSIQTLNITLGKDLTENTIKWSKELERAFGLSASGLIADLQGINAVLYGMGMNSQSTELAGRNLLAVGQTLAGITGYDLDTVIEKIESGMKGMTQSIDDLGLSVRESEMNNFLKQLRAQGGEFSNIATSFQNLTEQQRVYVRYAALMTQFRRQFDADDYVRSLDSITGRLMVLESRFRSLKTTIGNFALQLLDRITIPLASFITFIENRIKALAKLLGIDLEISSGMNKTADGAEKASKNLKDVNNALEDIEQTADKAKGGLDAFDHISNISSSGNGSGSPFDYSKLLDVAPDYAKELEDIAKLQDDWLEEQWKKFKEKIKAWLEETKNKISAWWKNLTGRIINWDEIINNLKQIWANIKQVLKNIKDIAIELFNIIAGLVGMILDDLNFTQLLVDITDLLVKITNFVKEFLKTVKQPLFDFYNNYLSKYVKEFGDWLHQQITKWASYFDELTAWAKSSEGKKDIEAWFDNIGKLIDDIVAKIRGIAVVFKVLLFGEDSLTPDQYTGNNQDHLVKKGDYTRLSEGGIDPRIVGIAGTLHDIFAEILSIVTEITKDFGEWFKTKGLNQIKSHLERISSILSENHDNFVNIIEQVATSINNIKETVLTKIEDILEWIGEHPTAVNTLLQGAEGLIKSIVKNIEKLVGAYLALKAIGGITSFLAPIGSLITAGKTAASAASAANAANAAKGAADAAKAIADAKTAEGAAKGAAKGAAEAAKAAKTAEVAAEGAGKIGLLGKLQAFTGIGLAIYDFLEAPKAIQNGIREIQNSWSSLKLDFGGKIDTTAVRDAGRLAGEMLGREFGYGTKTTMAQSDVNKYIESFINNLKKQVPDATNSEIIEAAKQFEWSLKNTVGEYKHYGTQIKQDTTDMVTVLKNTNSASTVAANGINTTTSKVKDFNNTTSAASNNLKTTTTSANDLSNTLKNTSNNIKDTKDNTKLLGSQLTTTKSAGKSAGVIISNSMAKANTQVKQLTSNTEKLQKAFEGIKPINSYTNNSNTGVKKVKSFFGKANGGVPSKGSIFMANENGMPELVSNFGGYTGVANQEMILKAMERSIGSSVYEAVSEAFKQNNGSGNKTTIEVCRQGMFVGDDNAIRKLAQKLDNALTTSKGNISNTSFSLT